VESLKLNVDTNAIKIEWDLIWKAFFNGTHDNYEYFLSLVLIEKCVSKRMEVIETLKTILKQNVFL